MEGKGKERMITALIIYINNELISAVETSLIIIIISHIPLVAPPSIVSGQTNSWWSLEYLC